MDFLNLQELWNFIIKIYLKMNCESETLNTF